MSVYNKRKTHTHTNSFNNTSKLMVEFRLYKPEGRNEGSTRCINSPVGPDQTSETSGDHSRRRGLPPGPRQQEPNTLHRRLITTWQPAARARRGAARKPSHNATGPADRRRHARQQSARVSVERGTGDTSVDAADTTHQ